MFRKNYLISFLTLALFLVGGMAVFAQTTAPVRGRVEIKGVDGAKPTPVAGALVEVYRMDVKTKLQPDTTDKKGGFSFAGLPLGADFVLSISGPGITPEIIPNIRAGREDLVINVLPGDGKKWTEEEVRQAIANPTGGNTQQNTKESEEAKKKREEYEKQVAEIKNKNEKAVKANEVVAATLKEGSAAFDAKNYDLAIAKFEEGYNADPEYAGSAPTLLNAKAMALIGRASETYNKSVKADDATKKAARESVKNDLIATVEASEKALAILKTATTADPSTQKNYDVNKFAAMNNRKNAYRLMAQTGVETTKGKEVLIAFQEYIAAEPDAAKKSKAQMDLALTLQDSGEYELAATEFKKVLEADPNNVEALAGAGLNMVTVGYVTMEGDPSKNIAADPAKGKEQLQEAANYLQKFIDTAPADHKLLASVKESISDLKAAQNLTPQKTKTPTTTKKKS